VLGQSLMDGGSGQLVMTPTMSSCPGPSPAYSIEYNQRGSDVAIGTIPQVYRQGDATSAYSMITIGCFDANSNFTAESIAPVSP
jgi:hypothetical protein